MKDRRFRNLNEYCDATGTKKGWVARQLGISRFQFSGLLYPDRYPVTITDDLATKIAAVLNQPADYVRRYYAKAA